MISFKGTRQPTLLTVFCSLKDRPSPTLVVEVYCGVNMSGCNPGALSQGSEKKNEQNKKLIRTTANPSNGNTGLCGNPFFPHPLYVVAEGSRPERRAKQVVERVEILAGKYALVRANRRTTNPTTRPHITARGLVTRSQPSWPYAGGE